MINTGTFKVVIDQVINQAPDQADQLYALAGQLASFSVSDLAVSIVERIVAFLYHVGASILVFYACKEKKYLWLYPLAIVIHTVLDGFMGLSLVNVITLSDWALEAIFGICAALVFFGAYFMLYKKDKDVTSANKQTV